MKRVFSRLTQSDWRWTVHPEDEWLKAEAKREGIWNLFIHVCMLISTNVYLFYGNILMASLQVRINIIYRPSLFGQLFGEVLANLDYGYICEIMGRFVQAPQVLNYGATYFIVGSMSCCRWGTEI